MTEKNLEAKTKVAESKPADNSQETSRWIVPLSKERKAYQESFRKMVLACLEVDKHPLYSNRPIGYSLGFAA